MELTRVARSTDWASRPGGGGGGGGSQSVNVMSDEKRPERVQGPASVSHQSEPAWHGFDVPPEGPTDGRGGGPRPSGGGGGGGDGSSRASVCECVPTAAKSGAGAA